MTYREIREINGKLVDVPVAGHAPPHTKAKWECSSCGHWNPSRKRVCRRPGCPGKKVD